MKQKIIYPTSIVLGALIGYWVGMQSGQSGWDFIKEVIFGFAIASTLADAFLKNEDKYAVLVGTILGLAIAVSLDWLAGSSILVTNKLLYMMMGSFVGWGASWGWAYWKPVLLGGLFGGIGGIILGLIRGCLFGSVYVPAGLLNAGLTFIQLSVAGMGLGSLYLKSIGWRHLEKISNR